MNGVIVTALVINLIFAIGLGFAVLTVHSELTRFMAQQKRQMTAAAEWRDGIEGRITACEETEAELGRGLVLSDGDFRSAAMAIQSIRSDVVEMKKKTKGTADEKEFLRMKNACLITLPNQIAKLDAIVTGKPYIARIEKQDGLIGMRYVVDDEVTEKFNREEKNNGKDESSKDQLT